MRVDSHMTMGQLANTRSQSTMWIIVRCVHTSGYEIIWAVAHVFCYPTVGISWNRQMNRTLLYFAEEVQLYVGGSKSNSRQHCFSMDRRQSQRSRRKLASFLMFTTAIQNLSKSDCNRSLHASFMPFCLSLVLMHKCLLHAWGEPALHKLHIGWQQDVNFCLSSFTVAWVFYIWPFYGSSSKANVPKAMYMATWKFVQIQDILLHHEIVTPEERDYRSSF